MMTDLYELLVPSLRVWVSLGCGDEEKANLQPVDIDIKVTYPKEPIGCHSDQLEDVVCYLLLTHRILDAIKNRSFNLVEHLAAHLFQTLAVESNLAGCWLELVIRKPHHPVHHVNQSIAFTYRRRLPQKSL